MNRPRQLTMTIIAMIFTVFLGIASANDAPASSSFSEADARETALKWATYVGQGDVPALERFLHEKYLHIHGTALVETRTQFLDELRNGTRKYDPINMEEITVRLFGSTAVVSGKFNLKAVVRGKTVEGVNRFSLVIVAAQDGRQVASFQATAIPQQK